MTLIRARDGVMHDIFATTSSEHMSNCGVFYKKHTQVNGGIVTCLRCVARRPFIYEIEVYDHG